MLFHEIYGAYFNTVSKLLRLALQGPVSDRDVLRVISESAFSESTAQLFPALKEQQWPLFHKNWTTPVHHAPSLPLTLLEKRWLKAITLDPRFQLFFNSFPGLDGIEPLFSPDDFCYYDRFIPADPYSDPSYITHFRLALAACREKQPLNICYTSQRGKRIHGVYLPLTLEYSEKNDCFRLVCAGHRKRAVIKLASIQSCQTSPSAGPFTQQAEEKRMVTLQIIDERNALERTMLHFSYYEKTARQLADGTYQMTLHYDASDETEVLIQILSFGPLVRVTAPDSFTSLIRGRLEAQTI